MTPAPPLRLGVYTDLRFEQDDGGVWADTAFVRFVAALGDHTDRLVVFGRSGAVERKVARLEAGEGEFVPLADYPSLSDLRGVARAVRPSRRALRARLADLDAVLLFGPHPIALALARDARRAGVPVVLGVRQDLPSYLVARAGRRSGPLVAKAAHSLERRWRKLAESCGVVVTGSELAANYAGSKAVLDVIFSLVDEEDVVEQPQRPWGATVEVLTVSRLDAEKNPLLLGVIAKGLAGDWPGWRLRIVGDGPLAAELADQVRPLGSLVELAGPVAHGEPLWAEYRDADAFLHVSHTEGVPQVLIEAMAAGLPIVATAVGGVARLLQDGRLGLLIPPDDAGAAITALDRLRTDPELRARITAEASADIHSRTRRVQAGRVVAFVRDQVARSGRGA